MKTTCKKLWLLVPVVVIVLGFTAPTAKASSFDFNLSAPNSGISAYSGPYVSIDITLTDSTHATITATSLTNAGHIFLMGDGGTLAFNVNGPFSLGAVTESNAGTGFTPTFKDQTSGQEDGFGAFNLQLNNEDGNGDAADKISFLLTLTSGNWASASDVLTANNQGAIAAAHIFVETSPANASNGALTTGFAANGGAVNASEPGLVVMLGAALVGLGVFRRRLIRGV